MGPKYLPHIVLITCIVLLCSTITGAAANVTVEIQGKKLTNLPCSVENGELLVPARAVVEEFGGTLLWQELLKVLTAKFDDGYEIKMQVGNTSAQISPGNQVKTMPVPPRQIGGQAMIPLQFFAQQFGFLYKWDESKNYAKVYKPSNWVQGLTFDESLQGEVLTVTMTNKVPYKTYILSNPDRLVIDLGESALSAKATNIIKECYVFRNVKIAQFSSDTVRVVLELTSTVRYKISDVTNKEGFQVKISFEPGIREVTLTEQGIAIKSSGEIGEYKIMEFTDPERLVIELMDQNLQLYTTTVPINHPLVKQVRSSQHSWEPKVARFVLDLNDKIEYSIIYFVAKQQKRL